MDGRVSPAAAEANRRLHEMRAALAALSGRPADPDYASHSEESASPQHVSPQSAPPGAEHPSPASLRPGVLKDSTQRRKDAETQEELPSPASSRPRAFALTSSPNLRAVFAALPPHLGWGSEALARHLRGVTSDERRATSEEGARGRPRAAGEEALSLTLCRAEREPAAPTALPNSSLVTRDSSLVTRHSSLLKVHPDLALGMLRTERAAAGRVWLLLRALDEPGRGMVSLDDARAALTGKESPLRLCGWRRLRMLLAEGEGVFWARERGRPPTADRRPRPEKSRGRGRASSPGPWPLAPGPSSNRLRLFGPARVAAALGVARLGNRPVAVPAAALLGGIGDARAQLYAAFHSGRARFVMDKVPGSRFQVPGEGVSSLAPGPWPLAPAHSSLVTRHSSLGMPIARDTLAALSGACPRSQAAYERRAGLVARGNYALGERVAGGPGAPSGPAEQERAWQQGRALFRLTDHHGQQGPAGATYLAWRLPNAYGSARGHQQRPKGRQKRINRELADLFTKGMTGNGAAAVGKRFYVSAVAAARGAEKKWSVASGQWSVASGQWLVRSAATGYWTVATDHSAAHWPDGRTRGGAGVWRVIDRRPPTADRGGRRLLSPDDSPRTVDHGRKGGDSPPAAATSQRRLPLPGDGRLLSGVGRDATAAVAQRLEPGPWPLEPLAAVGGRPSAVG